MKQKDLTHLIGIPYKELNCFGLCKKFYADILGLELKHYYDELPGDRDAMQDLVYSSKGDFVRVDVPAFGDIVVMLVDGLEAHIGVSVGNGLILHSSEQIGESVISRDFMWKKRIAGYYRLKPTE